MTEVDSEGSLDTVPETEGLKIVPSVRGVLVTETLSKKEVEVDWEIDSSPEIEKKVDGGLAETKLDGVLDTEPLRVLSGLKVMNCVREGEKVTVPEVVVKERRPEVDRVPDGEGEADTVAEVEEERGSVTEALSDKVAIE